ncbi:hypothetical protein BH10ACT4_BH10ACT4_00160 [soil metagenome]
MYLVLPGLGILLMIFALVDIIRADRWSIRYLDKSLWLIIVILLPLIGSVLWFTIGRDYGQSVDLGSFGDPRRREALAPVESATERELAALDREIERGEQDDRIRRLEARLRAHRGENSSETADS